MNNRKQLLGACLAVAALFAAPAHAQMFSPNKLVPDGELNMLRGGYLMAGGLKIDFGLTAQTLVNGINHHSFNINSQDSVNAVTPQNLRTVIQIGDRNSSLSGIENLPAFATIIRNTLDNTVIQNVSVLDVMVHNVALIRAQAMMPLLNFQSVAAVR